MNNTTGPTLVFDKPDHFKGALDALQRQTDDLCALGEVMAKIRRAHFDAYVAEGFTEEQALVLCQKVLFT